MVQYFSCFILGGSNPANTMKTVDEKFKTVYVVDPQKGERIHLSKQIKQEYIFIMAFSAMADCLKQIKYMPFDLMIFVLRNGKTESVHLTNLKKKMRGKHFILVPTVDSAPVDLNVLREEGFPSVQISNDLEQTREITYNLLWPGDKPPNRELGDPLANI